jgi:hypothetical protein
MKRYVCILFFLLLKLFSSQAQDTINNFRKSPFKYNLDESILSIGGGIVVGAGSRMAVVGTTFDIDFYHILISLRLLKHPMMKDKYQTMTDMSAMLGYQYRNIRILGSLVAGVGIQNYACASGISGHCYGNESEQYTAFSCKAGIDYAFSNKAAVGLMSQYSSNDREDIYTVLACFKLGFFRNK